MILARQIEAVFLCVSTRRDSHKLGIASRERKAQAMERMKALYLIGVIAVALYAAEPARAAITIDTTTATDWKISNGVISLDWNSTTGNIFAIHLARSEEHTSELQSH